MSGEPVRKCSQAGVEATGRGISNYVTALGNVTIRWEDDNFRAVDCDLSSHTAICGGNAGLRPVMGPDGDLYLAYRVKRVSLTRITVDIEVSFKSS